MKILQIGIIALACTFFTWSCSEKERAASTAEDYAEYQIEEVGGGIQKAVRTNEAGSIVETGYLYDGRKNGVWITWSNEGKIKSLRSYTNDRLCGPELTFTSRLMIEELTSYENDVLSGLQGKYRNGRPLEELRYLKGQLHGKQRFYFESVADHGKVQRTIDYRNGVIDGKMRYYTPEGKVTVEYEYKNGERVGGGMIKDQ